MVMENYWRSWTGGIGMYALKIADSALTASGAVKDRVKAAPTLADMPVIKAFMIRYPSSSAQSIQDFHERFRDSQTTWNSIKHLAIKGDSEGVKNELLLQENQENMLRLSGINKALGDHSKLIGMINDNPQMSSDDKRKNIDRLYYSMIELARFGNKAFEEVDKSLKGK
jgi:hypothetical protein